MADDRESYISHCCLEIELRGKVSKAKVKTQRVLIGLKLSPLEQLCGCAWSIPYVRYKSNDVIYNVGGTVISRITLLCPLSHGLSNFANAVVPFQVDQAGFVKQAQRRIMAIRLTQVERNLNAK